MLTLVTSNSNVTLHTGMSLSVIFDLNANDYVEWGEAAEEQEPSTSLMSLRTY